MNQGPAQERKVIAIDNFPSAQSAGMRHLALGPIGWDEMVAWLAQEVLGPQSGKAPSPADKPKKLSLAGPHVKLPATIEADLPRLLAELNASAL